MPYLNPQLLPIQSIRSKVISGVEVHQRAIVTADPGSGKSTQLPLFFLETEGKTIVAQPRRIAARSLAEYVSTSLGEKVGQRVGYRVRHDRRSSDKTKIEYVTDGILVRLIQRDPELKGITTVILDEFHERSLQLDLALAFLSEIQSVYRPDLRVIIMSATLDVQGLQDWFGGPWFHAPGRIYENEIIHATDPIDRNEITRELVRQAHVFGADPNARNIVAFLPGRREIENAYDLLQGNLHFPVSKLHGQLSLAEQSRVLSNGEKHFVLATNIAETSLTIPGVNRIIDTGWRREARYVESWAAQALFTSRITEFSAKQRAGRANRLSDGRVFRLWTQYEQNQLRPSDLPEIRTANLEQLYMECLFWGCHPLSLDWLTPPLASQIQSAERTLRSIGVLDNKNNPSFVKGHSIGQFGPRANAVMSFLSQEPIHERMRVATLLPMLDGERPPRKHFGLKGHALDNLPSSHPYTKSVRLIEKRLNIVDSKLIMPPLLSARSLQALLLGYPERLAKRRDKNGSTFLMANGTGARLHPSVEYKKCTYVLALSVGGQKASDLTIFDALPVEESWVPAKSIDEVFFSEADQKVIGRRRQMFGAIIMQDQAIKLPSKPDQIADTLADAAIKSPEQAFEQTAKLQQLCQRVAYANRQNLVETLPLPFNGIDTHEHGVFIVSLCYGHHSFHSLRQIDLSAAYLSSLPYPKQKQLDEVAPTALTLSNGKCLPVTYKQTHGPTLSTRFEWLFGVTTTPLLNHQPVMLELLAPNMRPVQLTRDLASFWSTGYPAVRSDLRGRYPKHPWPEDPSSAEPGLGRRRKHKPN